MASIILLSVAAGKTPTHNNILLYSGVYDGVRVYTCPTLSVSIDSFGSLRYFSE